VARAAASYDAAKARFVTWLFTIARNKVLDHHRRTSGVVHLADDIGAPAADEAADLRDLSPEHVAQNRQLAAAIVREVQALPYAQRETFVLVAQQELSLEEVAQITCVGLETAKSRLRYARSALRQRLAGWRVHHE
jgi:RNA polymerase sigma-70 factor (ECF subfamily)